VEFRVLGPLEVRADDGPLPLGGARQRALLALLVLNAGKVVPRERLIDGLWGEAPPESAVKGIQIYVWQLRKLLPDGTIVTRPSGYALEVEPESVDLGRFERLVAAAHGAAPDEAAQLLREALALWRGPPLAGLGDEPGLRAEAERLDELRLAALEDRIDAELALGRPAQLVGELERLIGEHSHRERLRAQLMVALYRSGRQAEALQAYRDARDALAELGLEPGAELRELERRILAQDASLKPTGERPLFAGVPPLPGPLVVESPFPFVGREVELAVLRDALSRAEGGEGRVVLLAAEAGGGKTRLIRELAYEAAARGTLVLYGSSDAAVTTPYQPLREWLEFLLRVGDRDALRECLGVGAGELARLVPELAAVGDVSVPQRRDPESERFALQAAVGELFARLSEGQPLLLVADDVHWADGETLHLLRRLARSAPRTSWLVLAAFRPEEAGQLGDTLADLGGLEATTRLTLGNLSGEDVDLFIRLSTQAEPSAELSLTIGALSDGTPLLLCELWRELRERGDLELGETVGLKRPASELRGPERLTDLVHQRLGRLARETVAVLELAAVTGASFELRLLADAAGLAQPDFVAAVEEAVDAGVIEELPTRVPACRFGHELVRRAVYDRIKRLRRAELHFRVGEALERVHAADPERVLPELAHHFTLAAPLAGPERAVEYNLRAGRAAVPTGAYGEAVARLETALTLGVADDRERAEIQIELGWLLGEARMGTEARAVLDEALAAATRLGDRGLVARANVTAAWQQRQGLANWDPEHARAIAEQAIVTFTELGDERGLADAWRLLANAEMAGGGLREAARAHLEQALEHAEAAGDSLTRGWVIESLAEVLTTGPTPVEKAVRRCQELRRASSEQRLREAIVESRLANLYAAAGRSDEARECIDRARGVLDDLSWAVANFLRLQAADTLRLLGDTIAAEQQLLAMWRHFGEGSGGETNFFAGTAASSLAKFCCDEGRWDEAERWFARAAQVPLPVGSAAFATRLTTEARLAAHRGDLDEAVTAARRAVEIQERTDYVYPRATAWLALAEVLRASDRPEEADAAFEMAVNVYEQKGNVAAVARLRAGELAVG
jgi:DNA-binding SARP family transcriptional activator